MFYTKEYESLMLYILTLEKNDTLSGQRYDTNWSASNLFEVID